MESRLEILRRLQAGEIGVDEAARLLETSEPAESPQEGEVIAVRPVAPSPERHWSRFWIYPLMAGAGVLILGALIMALVFVTHAARGWLVCGWLPLILGGVVLLIAVWSRWAKWLHVRVREEGGRRVAISFPLPLRLATWGLRIAQPFVPQLKQTGVDDLIIALRNNPRGEPICIDVEDGNAKVQVYIG